MAKAPAFQFYAADFLTDTAEMTDQEVGVYIRLLAHQWVNGSLNGDPKRLANGVAIGVLDVWKDIEHKFPACKDGRRRNPRLEETRKQQEEYRHKQAEAGKLGASKRWANKGGPGNNDSNANGNPIGNPNGKNIALQSSSSSSTTTTTSGKKKGAGSQPPKKTYKDLDYSSWPSIPSPAILADWMEVRRKRKATNTQTAINGIGNQLHEAAKSGLTVDQCIEEAVIRSWSGFKAEWMKSTSNGRDVQKRRSFDDMDYGDVVEDL